MNWLRPWPRNVMFYPQISLRSTSLRAPWNLCWTSALVHDHGHDAYYLRPRCSTCFYDGYKPVYPRRNPVVIAIIRQISCKIWLISSAFYPTFALDTTAVKLFTQQAFHTALRVTQQHHIANRFSAHATTTSWMLPGSEVTTFRQAMRTQTHKRIFAHTTG